jgi:hypothetical protein
MPVVQHDVGSAFRKEIPMTPREEKSVGLTLAAAGAGIMGASVVFGLTTEGGGVDWIGIVMATAGLIMVLTGLFRGFRSGTPHAG